LRFLTRIPESAAVNESVNLVKGARVKSAAAFVNAVLRRVTREPNYDPASGSSGDVERIAIETSHPPWLIERWILQFGIDDAAAIARANDEPAPLAFRFTAKAFRDWPEKMINELRTSGVELMESRIAPGAWRISRLSRENEATGKD